jgi:hypothetical protein
MNTIRTWRGVVAEICWTPGRDRYPAAGIRGYTIARAVPTGRLTLRATVLLSDAFKLAQRPLTFVLPCRLGKPPHQRDAEFLYPLESFTLRDSVLEGTLGPRIRGTHAALPFCRPDPRQPIVVVRG